MSTFFPKTAIMLALLLMAGCSKTTKESNTAAMQTTDNDKRYQPQRYVEIKHPEWSKSATIYEVNLRQYTPEGTIKAFELHLPRLKE